MDIELKDFSPPALCAAIKEEWGIDVKPDDITLPSPWDAGPYRHYRRYGCQIFKSKSGWCRLFSLFRTRSANLRDLENENLGVATPKLLHVGTKIAMFAMTKLDAHRSIEA